METFGISPHLGAITRSFPYITPKSVLARLAYCQKPCWLSYSLCDKFNLYSSDRSLCPLCLCGSFHGFSVHRLLMTVYWSLNKPHLSEQLSRLPGKKPRLFTQL